MSKQDKYTKSAVKVTYSDHQISVIYLIVNKMNGKLYVGQTVNLYERYKKHEHSVKRECKNRPIVLAFKKYGFHNFSFVILEKVEKNKELLTIREQYWMDKLKSYERKIGYNACPAANSPLGYKHSRETRRKVSIASTGRVQSKETREKRSKYMSGRLLSEETKKRISRGKAGMPVPKKYKPIAKICRNTGKIIERYKSLSLAAESVGESPGNITRACKEQERTAKGYRWRYV